MFFCGTGSNSFDFRHASYHSGELVSTLARHSGGSEFVDWIIVDGPGSGNLQEDEKFVQPGNYSQVRGGLLGSGWEENVAHALAMIHGEPRWSRQDLTALNHRVLTGAGVPVGDPVTTRGALGLTSHTTYPKRPVTPQALQMQKIKISRGNRPITQINVIGWSRGAVSTHMFANALAKDPDLHNIPVHLIAVDPVPGLGNFQLKRTSLPKNVQRYVAFYARDERSLGFAATLPSMPAGLHPVLYPLPGRHATLVGNAGNYIAEGNNSNGRDMFYSPGMVVRMLSEHYLRSWGTSLNSCLPFSEPDMLRCYGEMLVQREDYKQLSKKTYTTRFGQRNARDIGLGQNWRSTKFNKVGAFGQTDSFINWHHRELFGRLNSPELRYPTPAIAAAYERLG